MQRHQTHTRISGAGNYLTNSRFRNVFAFSVVRKPIGEISNLFTVRANGSGSAITPIWTTGISQSRRLDLNERMGVIGIDGAIPIGILPLLISRRMEVFDGEAPDFAASTIVSCVIRRHCQIDRCSTRDIRIERCCGRIRVAVWQATGALTRPRRVGYLWIVVDLIVFAAPSTPNTTVVKRGHTLRLQTGFRRNYPVVLVVLGGLSIVVVETTQTHNAAAFAGH